MADQFAISSQNVKAIQRIRQRIQFLSSALAKSQFKGSFATEAALIAVHGTPKEGWTYFNSDIGQTLTFHKNAWYQYTIDGENGSTVDYKGNFDVAPLDPVTDDAYGDDVDGVIYIYNGVAWEIMSQSGGLIVITYHDSNFDATPVPATGTGEADGWHLDATEDVNWLAQQYNAGDWGTPIPAANLTGAVGPQGPQGDPGDPGEDGTDGSGLSADVPRLADITFIANGSGGKVGWSAGTLTYQGSTHNIAAKAAASGETGTYLYWDLDGTTTTFASTNTIEDSFSGNRWPMCFNEDDEATPAAANKVIIGLLLKVSNLAAINASLGSITGGSIKLSGLNGAEEPEATALYQMRMDGGGIQGRWRASGNPTAWGDWRNIIDITGNEVKLSFDSFDTGETISGIGTNVVAGSKTVLGVPVAENKGTNSVGWTALTGNSDTFSLAHFEQGPFSAELKVGNGTASDTMRLRLGVFDASDDSFLGYTAEKVETWTGVFGTSIIFAWPSTDEFVDAGAEVGMNIYCTREVRDTGGNNAVSTTGVTEALKVENVQASSTIVKT